MNSKKKVAILGSTGSIGESSIRVLQHLDSRFEVTLLAADKNFSRLARQSAALDAKKVYIANPKYLPQLKNELPPDVQSSSDENFLLDAVSDPALDIVICAIIGTGGLRPVIQALKCGKTVALASKEVMVMAGEYVKELEKIHHGKIIPVDSEHSAIYQCLDNRKSSEVKNLILTSSGGPFRNADAAALKSVKVEDALRHPVWSMGKKITIDSASMMNKALEFIEASYLFNVPSDKIRVLIHPEAIIHSMVEFNDNSLLALLSTPSMELPIQYALTAPLHQTSTVNALDFSKLKSLTFQDLNEKIFPSLDFARHALHAGGAMPAILNAANEVAVKRFCSNEIDFCQIWSIVEKTMNRFSNPHARSLEDIFEADSQAREFAKTLN